MLDSLEKAAQALDCRLVYGIVPRKPLELLVEERASRLAKKRLKSTAHSMALEAQGVEKADEEAQLEWMTKRLLEQSGSALWKDE